MAINKKLIHFNKKEDFLKEKEAGNILDRSIIFIKDTKEIWTHDLGYLTIPEGGTEGQVITKTEDGFEWKDVSTLVLLVTIEDNDITTTLDEIDNIIDTLNSETSTVQVKVDNIILNFGTTEITEDAITFKTNTFDGEYILTLSKNSANNKFVFNEKPNKYPADNQIVYETTDGEIIYVSDASSNVYYKDLGFGIMTVNSTTFPILTNNKTLKSIIVGTLYTTIPQESFRNCSNLKEAIFKGATTFKYGSGYDTGHQFSNCTSLETIIIAEGTTELAKNMFKNCTSLKNITIPDSVTKIEAYCFMECISLLTIDTNLAIISESSFNNCKSLSYVKLNNNITQIPKTCFYGCESLHSIDLPDSILELGNLCFEYSGLETITIPTSVTIIGDNALNYSKLKNLTIPKSVKSMPKIGNLNHIDSIVLPDIENYGVEFFKSTSIRKITFSNCQVTAVRAWINIPNVEEVIIPSNYELTYGTLQCDIGSPNLLDVSCSKITTFPKVDKLRTLILRYNGVVKDVETYISMFKVEEGNPIPEGATLLDEEGNVIQVEEGIMPLTNVDAYIDTPNNWLKIFVPAKQLDAYRKTYPTLVNHLHPITGEDIFALKSDIPTDIITNNEVDSKIKVVQDLLDEYKSEYDNVAADVTTIKSVIPNQAASDNQLADKDFVNSSIATNTAEFKGTFNSLLELQDVLADENDYGFVKYVDDAGNTVYNRYKYSDGWKFEYSLNNSSFTSNQWLSINSNITESLVEKLSALPTSNEITSTYSTKTELNNYLPLSGGKMSNTNVVTNLNADMVDGKHDGEFTALKLTTPCILWGLSFDGTKNIDSNITVYNRAEKKNVIVVQDLYNSNNSSGSKVGILMGAPVEGRTAGVYSVAESEWYNTVGLAFEVQKSTEVMRISHNENVGIGTPTPLYKLHVVGDIYATGSIMSNNLTQTVSITNTVYANKINICSTENNIITTLDGFSKEIPEAIIYSLYPITFNNNKIKKAQHIDYLTTESGYYVYTLRYLPISDSDYVVLVNGSVYE